MRVLLILLFALIYQIDAHNDHGGHGSSASAGPPHVARKMEDYVHDVEHLQHDLEGQVNKPKEHMTPEEQNFYYFKLHDTNNDNRLDGLEIVAAFDHAHQEDANKNDTATPGTPPEKHEKLADEELMRIVDDILTEEDLDHDGYISYEEFKRAIEGNSNAQG